MNTPDNRPEAVLDRILEKAGVIPPHTPDTEWETVDRYSVVLGI